MTDTDEEYVRELCERYGIPKTAYVIKYVGESLRRSAEQLREMSYDFTINKDGEIEPVEDIRRRILRRLTYTRPSGIGPRMHTRGQDKMAITDIPTLALTDEVPLGVSSDEVNARVTAQLVLSNIAQALENWTNSTTRRSFVMIHVDLDVSRCMPDGAHGIAQELRKLADEVAK